MATLRATIRKDKINTEGLSTVQIAISHHQKTAYISTDIKVPAKDFVGGMLVRGTGHNSINAQIIAELNKYNERLEHLENIDARTVSQIKDSICTERVGKYHKVSECFEAFMRNKNNSSKTSYHTAHKVFCVFCKDNDINIESIDCAYIEKYNRWLHEFTPFRTQQGRNKKHSWTKIEEHRKDHPQPKHYSESSIATYLAHLKAVINWCISEGWVTYKVHPFAKTTIVSPPRRENIISAEELNLIRLYSSDNMRYQRCKDMFMLSFMLGGANIADMAKFNFNADTITFERQKVASRLKGRAKVVLPIIPEAREIASKYINSKGYLDLGREKNTNVTSDYNYCIQRIAEDVGIKTYVTFTSARKAFAQIGTELGISDNYLNYLMGHSMSKARGMMNPYSSMDVAMAGEILKTIVAMSMHPDKIKQVFQSNLNSMLSRII